MSDPDVTIEGSENQKKKGLNPKLRPIIIGAGVLLLLAIVALAGNIRANQARVAAVKAGANGLEVAVRQQVLVQDRDKLRILAQEIAEAANYQSVTFTDETGQVLASTNTVLIGSALDHMKKPPLETEMKGIDGYDTVYRAVALGGSNVVGGISIQLKP